MKKYSSKFYRITLICPFCSIMYEGNQRKIEKMITEELGIPVFYYPQVLGLAPEELGFSLNRVKPKKFLEKVSKG